MDRLNVVANSSIGTYPTPLWHANKRTHATKRLHDLRKD